MNNSSAPETQVSEYASLCAQLGELSYQAALIESRKQQTLQAIDQLRLKEQQEQALRARVAAEVEAEKNAKEHAADVAGA